MLSRRMPLLAVLGAAGALAAGAPAAHAITMPSFSFASGFPLAAGYSNSPWGSTARRCGSQVGGEGQGPAGGVNQTVCGTGLVFVGPSTSINNVIGPTIISPGFAGTVIVAGGNVGNNLVSP